MRSHSKMGKYCQGGPWVTGEEDDVDHSGPGSDVEDEFLLGYR